MLASNVQLGPYRIVAQIGAGGMGEVYRASDARLGRDVAVKVLPASFATDSERLRRFEQEARAAGVLNHPNILAIHDIGHHDGAPYVVSELLEGETLRERLANGRLPVRKAIEIAAQIASGLAAAHDKGIVHRDLKPENVFLTKDGHAKILDFGLARITTVSETLDGDSPTAPIATDPGVVMGTVGYMSPEQVRGVPADTRSDIFAFGVLLYELVSGERAFRRDSSVETMNAILKEEPPELSSIVADTPPALERIIAHCLEKQPTARFQSARDLAFSLGALSDVTQRTGAVAALPKPRRRLAAIVAVALIAIAGAFIAGKLFAPHAEPTYRRLTYRRAVTDWARYAPDGKAVYYDVRGDESVDTYEIAPPATEARDLGMRGVMPLALSSRGELAVLVNPQSGKGFTFYGTLATMPAAGGTPRELLDYVECADYSPDGSAFAIVRLQNRFDQIEYPAGKVLYRTQGQAAFLRVLPDDEHLAFIEQTFDTDSGHVAVVDRKGVKRDLTPHFDSIRGLAWSAPRKEIWFTGALKGATRMLYAVDLDGRMRVVERMPGSYTLGDVSADGRALIVETTERKLTRMHTVGEEKDRDLSWLDWTVVREVWPDGSRVLLEETGEGGGGAGTVFLRKTDGSPALRLGPGSAASVSPELQSVVVRRDGQLFEVPLKAGAERQLTEGKESYYWGQLLRGGKQLVVARFESAGTAFYVENVGGGGRRTLIPAGRYRAGGALSPDGTKLLLMTPPGEPRIVSMNGGAPTPVHAEKNEFPAGWCADSRCIFVAGGSFPAEITRIDLASGKREKVGVVTAQGASLSEVSVAADAKSWAYTTSETDTTLYEAAGLR